MPPITLVIADDHPLFRDGLRLLLGSLGDMEVVGEASTGEEAVALALAVQPQVVLMDIQMPQMHGIDATRAITQALPQVQVLMLTMFEDDDSVFAALRAGASGYVLKGARQEETLRAIRAVANGEVIFGPGVAQRVRHFLDNSRATREPLFPELTDREYEVLQLLGQRCSNAEIAARLVLSPKTVRNHVSNIIGKLRVADRAAAMLAARAAGFGAAGGVSHE
jgi:DNA-binding NarL/FixJ family response regulator